MENINKNLPIGVFDSGVGGLTVLKALQAALPNEDYVYLGDTARLPYGTKTPETVQNYAIKAADTLIQRGVKVLVVACNTASSVALEALQAAFPFVPVIGVVVPGARACYEASSNGRIAVMATESTVAWGAYEKAIYALNPKATVVQWPCSLLVPLVEEGWVEGALVQQILKQYLGPLWDKMGTFLPDCLLLGCTHFPMLKEAIQKEVGDEVLVVDSAEATACAVRDILKLQGGFCDKAESGAEKSAEKGRVTFLATDGLSRFARVAKVFLNEPIAEHALELV